MAMTQEKKRRRYLPPRCFSAVLVGPSVQLTCQSVGLGGCPPGQELCLLTEACVTCGDPNGECVEP